jgi:hypothetical protein
MIPKRSWVLRALLSVAGGLLLVSACAGKHTSGGGSGGNSSSQGGTSGEPNPTSCVEPADCVVLARECCGCEPATADDLVAANAKYVANVAGCNLLPCDPCAAPQEDSLGYFVADCVAQKCALLDLRSTPLTACQSDSDCHVRNGNGCCPECGNSSSVIALSDERGLAELVCPREDYGCPDCVAAPPPNAVPVCRENHCQVAYRGPVGP